MKEQYTFVHEGSLFRPTLLFRFKLNIAQEIRIRW